MLKIWGRTSSINVQKVLWCCAELGLTYERTDAGGKFGLVGEDWYLAMNPNGRVPVIDDDGFVLWESNVIVRYLAAKHDSELYPAEPRQRALAEQWMDWEQATVEPGLRPIFWNLVRTPPEQRDYDAVEEGRRTSAGIWGILDAHLATRPYVTGERFTMGDIPVGAAAHRWFSLDIERPELAHLRNWYERLSQREGYRAHVALPLT